MSRPLPQDREKALEAIANGWGREATRAHPLCTCGRTSLEPCSVCLVGRDEPCIWPGTDERPAGHSHWQRDLPRPVRCVVHDGISLIGDDDG